MSKESRNNMVINIVSNVVAIFITMGTIVGSFIMWGASEIVEMNRHSAAQFAELRKEVEKNGEEIRKNREEIRKNSEEIRKNREEFRSGFNQLHGDLNGFKAENKAELKIVKEDVKDLDSEVDAIKSSMGQ